MSVRGQKERLEEVIEAVNAVTARSHGGCLGGNSGGEEDPWVPEAVPTGWAAVDRWLAGGETPIHRGSARGPTAGGLVRGAVHEWFGLGRSSSPGSPGSTKVLFGAVSGRMAGTETSGGWAPPLGLLVHLAGQALRGALAEVPAPGMGARETRGERIREGYAIWLGRRIWPYPCGLVPGHLDLLRRSLFLDPPDDAGRLWAIDLALRCPAFTAVIADGSGLKMPQTRRLQLTAGESRALVLIVRPPWERAELSAATTRWVVDPVPRPAGSAIGRWATMRRSDLVGFHDEDGGWRGSVEPFGSGGAAVERSGPRWRVTLVRCKGKQTCGGGGLDQSGLPRSWLLEQDHEQGVVRVSADVVDRPGAAAAERIIRTERSSVSASRRTA